MNRNQIMNYAKKKKKMVFSIGASLQNSSTSSLSESRLMHKLHSITTSFFCLCLSRLVMGLDFVEATTLATIMFASFTSNGNQAKFSNINQTVI